MFMGQNSKRLWVLQWHSWLAGGVGRLKYVGFMHPGVQSIYIFSGYILCFSGCSSQNRNSKMQKITWLESKLSHDTLASIGGFKSRWLEQTTWKTRYLLPSQNHDLLPHIGDGIWLEYHPHVHAEFEYISEHCTTSLSPHIHTHTLTHIHTHTHTHAHTHTHT